MQRRRSLAFVVDREVNRRLAFNHRQEWRNGCLSSRKLALWRNFLTCPAMFIMFAVNTRGNYANRFASKLHDFLLRCMPAVVQRLKYFNITAFWKNFRLFCIKYCISKTWNFLLILNKACRHASLRLKKTFWLFFVWSARGREDGEKAISRLQIERRTFLTFYRLKNFEFELVIGSRWRRVFGKWQGS